MGKQLIFDALTSKKTERVPWLPFVGCHAGALIGKSAEEYLKSGELIAQGVREAIWQYRPDGIPVMFDLQIEAEGPGDVHCSGPENPPAVVSHVLNRNRYQPYHCRMKASDAFPKC